MTNISYIFAGVGFIIILGFLAHLFFKKTKIPDVIWLLFLGLLIGPVFRTVDSSIFLVYSPYFAALAVMIILFEGGLSTDLYTLIKESPLSLALSLTGIVLSMFVVTPIMYYIFKWPVIYGLILGAMIGGSSSAIVISITEGMKLNPNIKTVLNLESTITDVLSFVFVIALIRTVTMENSSISLALHDVFSNFSIGAFVGLIVGIVWLTVLRKIRRKPFEYMLTLAILFILYAFIEAIKGSGAIGALTFGIVIGNAKDISRILRTKEKLIIDTMFKKFHMEITFLVRSFFFVYLGLLVSIKNIWLLLVGIIITLFMFFTRIIAVRMSTMTSKIKNYEKKIMSIMMPRGLAAAVLSQFPVTYGLRYTDVFTNIAFIVIVCSIFICTLGMVIIKK